jgi:CPA2 family monovalent cation:H+ antiporter-2
VTLQIGMVVAMALPIALLTLPFVPPYGVLGVIVAYLGVLGIGFWRTATDLDKHTGRAPSWWFTCWPSRAQRRHRHVRGGARAASGTRHDCAAGSGGRERSGRKTLGDLNLRGRTGATVVALSRDGQRMPLPTAATRLQADDMLALTGAGTRSRSRQLCCAPQYQLATER